MTGLTRRSVLRASLSVAATATLGRPYIAIAAAKTAVVWWTQGFAEEEDIAFKKIATDYEKASGNTLDYSVIPYAPGRQKIVSAVTTGEVPDLFQNNLAEILALYAWDDKLVDVSDVVESQKDKYSESALRSVCYNRVQGRRSIYGVPYLQAGLLNHVWRPLVEEAGSKPRPTGLCHRLDGVARLLPARGAAVREGLRELPPLAKRPSGVRQSLRH
jgi:multiple sugar transport system substrate-binding protein